MLLLTALSSGTVARAQTLQTGRTIRQLTAGDYVLPRFSPSGQLLAFSQVLADTGHENTRILILSMRRSDLDTLLEAEAATRYATYKAFVSDFEWLGDSSILAWIQDGDVGVTKVTFDVRSKRIVREEHFEGDEDSVPPYQSLADSLGNLYPEVATSLASSSDVFGTGLGSRSVQPRAAVLLQKRHAGVDHDVWLYRLDRPEKTRILPLSGGGRASLAGGFATSRDIIFAAGSDTTLGLYRWRAGYLDTLMHVPARPRASELFVRQARADSAWFILRLHAPYEHGNNPAFLYDGERLLPLADYPELADFDVHPTTRRIGFVYWDGGQRHLVVKELVTK